MSTNQALVVGAGTRLSRNKAGQYALGQQATVRSMEANRYVMIVHIDGDPENETLCTDITLWDLIPPNA